MNTLLKKETRSWHDIYSPEDIKMFVIQLKNHYRKNKNVSVPLCSFIDAVSKQKAWEALDFFVADLISISTTQDDDFYIDIIDIILEKLNKETIECNTNVSLTKQILFAILTEIAIKIELFYKSLKQNKNIANNIGNHLLAKSNITKPYVRICLFHYLAQINHHKHLQAQSQRVIGRFGQTLLEELFTQYFNNKKTQHLIIDLLRKDLHLFFITSTESREICHAVMKNFLLKHPKEFPDLLLKYHQTAKNLDNNAYFGWGIQLILLLHLCKEVTNKKIYAPIYNILLEQMAELNQRDLTFYNKELSCTQGILTEKHRTILHKTPSNIKSRADEISFFKIIDSLNG